MQITAAVPCVYTGRANWDIDVKESKSFSGSGLPTSGDPKTPVTGQCGLAFGTPPSDAAVGAVLTGNPFDPTGPPLIVAIVNGSGAPAAGVSVPVTVSLAPGSGLGPLTGTTTQVTADGIATFPDLRVGSPGGYAIKAEVPGQAPLFSGFFSVDTS